MNSSQRCSKWGRVCSSETASLHGRLVSRIWHRSGKLAFVPEVDAATHPEIADRYRWAVSWARSLKGQRVADIGCWTGTFLEHLAAVSQPDELVGIDLRGPWLEEARARNLAITFVPVDSLLPPIGDHLHGFDTVFFLETLEHLQRGSESQVLKNLAEMLVPSGELILSTPAAGLAAITDPAWFLVGHRHYASRRLVKLCEDAGLVIREVAYSGNFWSILDLNLLYLSKHVLRRTYHASRYISTRADTGLYSTPRVATNNLWIRAIRPLGRE